MYVKKKTYMLFVVRELSTRQHREFNCDVNYHYFREYELQSDTEWKFI
jgi:hypothetical protein